MGVVISPLVDLMDKQVTSKFSIHNWLLLSQFGIHFKVELRSQAGVRSMRLVRLVTSRRLYPVTVELVRLLLKYSVL